VEQSRKQGKKKETYEEDEKQLELLERPKDYVVKFHFPNPPPLSPPVLGVYGKSIVTFLSFVLFWEGGRIECLMSDDAKCVQVLRLAMSARNHCLLIWTLVLI
jgi:hypothetical protein